MELFKLSDEEAAEYDRLDKARKEAAERGPSGLTEDELIELHSQLAEEYPEPWSLENLGMKGYVEVAINGKFFDPRAQAGYRPLLLRAVKTAAQRQNVKELVETIGTGFKEK
jgi:hypothetical protein